MTIQGRTADLYTEEERTYLVWEGQDGILFWFSGNKISADDLIKVAESVQPVTGQMPDFQMTWVPDDYTKYERVPRGNAVQETWLGPDTSFTLLYAAVPLELPDGVPESLRVNGAEAQYWQAEEPYESSGGSMTVNGEPVEGSQAEVAGVTVSVGTVVGPNAAPESTPWLGRTRTADFSSGFMEHWTGKPWSASQNRSGEDGDGAAGVRMREAPAEPCGKRAAEGPDSMRIRAFRLACGDRGGTVMRLPAGA